MITEDLSYNPAILERFDKINRHGRLAHAYLLIGPTYVGKKETALSVAKLVNCEGEHKQQKSFCDECPSCIKINSGNHPDIHIIESEEGEASIKIAQIRGLLEQIKLRPFCAVKKVFIIKNIEEMTLEGANALLKTLEEPSPNSLLLLTTSVPEKNLGTIRSRCHAIYFPVPTNDYLAARLEKDYNEEEQSAHVLGYFAEGCLGTAKKLKEERFFETKNEIIDDFILSDSGEPYIKTLLNDKDKTKRFLDVLLSWIHDAILVKVNVNEKKVIHIDRIDELKQFELKFTIDDLRDFYNEIVGTRQMLADNFNLKMPLLIIKEKLHG